jgi:hypothetical protein
VVSLLDDREARAASRAYAEEHLSGDETGRLLCEVYEAVRTNTA